MPHVPASPALARFRVIDLTQVRAGPTACRQLADWGADVIQVQMPEHMRGDDTLGGQDGSDYQYTHRNKRSVTLNLKAPQGISALKQLIATADVVVENFRPDVKFRLGIDYETLAKDHPRLVYASISGFGQTGPLASRPGFDQIAQGMSGMMSVTGRPGEGPMRVGAAVIDVATGADLSLVGLRGALDLTYDESVQADEISGLYGYLLDTPPGGDPPGPTDLLGREVELWAKVSDQCGKPAESRVETVVTSYNRL